jgi:hypothetical protein
MKDGATIRPHPIGYVVEFHLEGTSQTFNLFDDAILAIRKYFGLAPSTSTEASK